MMPKVSKAVTETVLMQCREPGFKDRMMAKMEVENPLVSAAVDGHLELIKRDFGLDAMCQVGQFWLLTYALFDAQAEVDELESGS